MNKLIFFLYWSYCICILSEIICLILFWIKIPNVDIPFLRYLVTIITAFSIIVNLRFLITKDTNISKIVIMNGSSAIIIIPLLIPIYQKFVIIILGYNICRFMMLIGYGIHYFGNIIYLYFMKMRRKITMPKNSVQVMSADI